MNVTGNSIQIEAQVQFSGPGKDIASELIYMSEIQDAWTGVVGNYNLNTSVLYGGSGSIDIEIWAATSGRPKAELGGNKMWLNSLQGATVGQVLYSRWAAGHEFGHIARLIDLYDYGTGAAWNGFGNDLMGAVGGTLSAYDIGQLLSANGC